MNDMNTPETFEQSDTIRSKADFDEIRVILSKISSIGSKIVNVMPQQIRNFKTDVTQLFFRLIDLFSTYFEISALPQNNARVLFSYFLTLHHFAVDLYSPGASHTDAEFTSLWKNFSWIFKTMQQFIFPSDYNHAINQITQGFAPILPRLEEQNPEDREINTIFKRFMYSVNNLQDPCITTESFDAIFTDFSNLKLLIRKFCQKIKLIPPHLFNALSLTEYILSCVSYFIRIRDLIKTIDSKTQESTFISIHLPIDSTDLNIHRRFLKSSIKINQVENRLIYNKILENNKSNFSQTQNPQVQDLSIKIDHSFYLATTILMHFSALLGIYRDSQLLPFWRKYIAKSKSFLFYLDTRGVQLQKTSSQNGGYSRNRNSEQMILSNLANEVSLVSQDSNVFALYDEFYHLYAFIVNDQSSRSLHSLSHCLIILLKIINETNSDGVKCCAMKAIDMIIIRIIVSKVSDDQSRFENIIKVMNEQKRKIEQQQKQYHMQQQPPVQMQSQSQQAQSKQQIGSLPSTTSDGNGVTAQNSKQSNIVVHQTLISDLPASESSYQSLVALCDHTAEVIKSISINKQSHPIEWQTLSNYQDYLDLLVAISAPYRNGDDQIPIDFIKYHPSIDQITECLSKFFIDTANEMHPFSVTVPPIIFSSYPTSKERLSPSDMQNISALLLTEQMKEHNAQYVISEFSKLNIYIAQIKAFLEKFKTETTIENNLLIEANLNQKFCVLVINLIKLKAKSLFSVEESREMAESFFPLFLKSIYKRTLTKIRIDHTVYKIIKTLYVPRCIDLVKTCYLTLEFFDSLLNKIPALKLQISDLKSFIWLAFADSIEFQRFNQAKPINKIIEFIIKEIRESDPRTLQEASSYLENFEKFITLCKNLDLISNYFKEYEIEEAEKEKIDIEDRIAKDKTEEQLKPEDPETNNNNNEEVTVAEDNEMNNEDGENSNIADDPDNISKESEPKLSSNHPYQIPYVPILAKVNHISLIRQKLIEGRKLNLFLNRNLSNQETETEEEESLDDFCAELVSEIDETLSTNKFIYISNSKLDDIMKKFSQHFNLSIVLKNLLNYFEEWASYLRNLNEMSAIPELVCDRNLKYIKTQLSESLNNMQYSMERINSTIRLVKKRSLELQKDSKTMESFMVQYMGQNYCERATNVVTLFLLMKYPICLENNNNNNNQEQKSTTTTTTIIGLPIPSTTATTTGQILPTFQSSQSYQSSSQQALPQIQHIRYQNGTSSASSLPFSYGSKSQQPTQQSTQQVIPINIQKYQQGISYGSTSQQSQLVQAPKFSITVPLVANNGAHILYQNQNPHQSAIFEASNVAAQKIYEIIRHVNELPRSQSTVSMIEKCKDLIKGNFPQYYGSIMAISNERINNIQISELKTLKMSLMSNICKLESNSKRKELLSLNDHFRRCLNLIDQQSIQKDEQIESLRQTIEGLKNNLREIEMKMPREEAASPEVISALDSILNDDILTSFIGDGGLITPSSITEPNLSSSIKNNPESTSTIDPTSSSSNNTIRNSNGSTLSNGAPRRRGKQRGRGNPNSQQNQCEQPEETTENNSEQQVSNSSSISPIPSSTLTPTAAPKQAKKSASSLVVNSLLNQVKNAEILNKRLRRKIEKLRFPSSSSPLSQEKFTAAYPLNLDTYEGCSWIASNAKDSSSLSSRNELSKLQAERDSLFEQMVRTNASKSIPLKPEMIENLYTSIVNACQSANSSSSANGKVSKSTVLSFVEKSDSLFTYIDYDIKAIKDRLKLLRSQNRMTPAEHIAQFTRKLQSME